MNYIESAEIRGFWGSKSVQINFYEDVNFLIGPNGCGKTTVINLIAAVLRADTPALYSIIFDHVILKLKSVNGRQKPIIEARKTSEQNSGNIEIKYTIKEKTSEKGVQYVVEGPFDERLYREMRHIRKRHHGRRDGLFLSKILANVIEVNWLSVHRTDLERDRRFSKEESFDSTVDQKLSEISRSFSHYFSLLASNAEQESKNFQELVFLSLLDQVEDIDELLEEISAPLVAKETVVEVLKELGVTNAKATKSVTSYLSRVEKAQKRWTEDEPDLPDAVTLSDSNRIKDMIEKWGHLQRKRADIFKPRIQFEELINELFSGKKLHFDERNNPKIQLLSGDEVEISALSSGEKQLFILLGEALLQEGRPVVFISDEPELSLHVNWQNVLFRNIRALNNSCQIISATHSPDIVGGFTDRVIKIENCISDV